MLNFLKKLPSIIAITLTGFLGEFKWKPPVWWQKLRAKPFVLFGLLFVLLISISGYQINRYYQQQPQLPRLTTLIRPMILTAYDIPTTAESDSAQATKEEDTTEKTATDDSQTTLKPTPLIVQVGLANFWRDNDTQQISDHDLLKQNWKTISIAPIDKLGKKITSGVTLKPALAGEWQWSSDSSLTFTPATPWPADENYTVSIDETLLIASKMPLNHHRWIFHTAPLMAKISHLHFVQDPKQANHKEIIGTLQFNYPIDRTSLEKRLVVTDKSPTESNWNSASTRYPYTLSFDDKHQRVYVHIPISTLPENEKYVWITLNKNLLAKSGGNASEKIFFEKALLPNANSLLKIVSIDSTIVRQHNQQPDLVLEVETSQPVKLSTLQKTLTIYALPETNPHKKNHSTDEDEWQNVNTLTKTDLTTAKPVTIEPIVSELDYHTHHHFKIINAQSPYLYIKVDRALECFGGYHLKHDDIRLIKTTSFPQEVNFLHKGALLSYASEKQVSLIARDLPALKINIARLLPSTLQHLMTQTEGDLNNFYFKNESFNEQNISNVMQEIRPLNNTPHKAVYTALNLEPYIKKQQGVFIVSATGWDESNQTNIGETVRRILLVTDMTFIVKHNLDNSVDVFVQSISNGTPVSNATIHVLGKNGISIAEAITDDNGHVHLTALNNFSDEKKPTVITATSKEDFSFIPFDKNERFLNYSKYNVDGTYLEKENDHLSAFLFTERGIYRPGETLHIAGIIKKGYAQKAEDSIPLTLMIRDVRGNIIFHKIIRNNESGYFTTDFAIPEDAISGDYNLELNLIKKKNDSKALTDDATDENGENVFLALHKVRIGSFSPDELKIQTSFPNAEHKVWLNPNDLKAMVHLENLFGSAAEKHRISASITLENAKIRFPKFEQYHFTDPLDDSKKPAAPIREKLADLETDANGNAEFSLDVSRFAQAHYRLTFYAQGYMKAGGRNVSQESSLFISPLPYFIGYQTSEDLHFLHISNSDKHAVHFIAISPDEKAISVANLHLQLLKKKKIATLSKQDDGSYQYSTINQEIPIKTIPWRIDSKGSDYNLPSDTAGDFVVQIMDAQQQAISRLEYTVVGNNAEQIHNNELRVILNKKEYAANDIIEMQITAPYAGSGLITIERDRVYASQWFKTNTSNSTQTIKIPENFIGNGYINIAYTKDFNAQEIFINPLSYAVIPFSVSKHEHTTDIQLNAPKEIKPGSDLTIEYKTNHPAKIIVFAVDEGILQTTHFETPNPLNHFFQKQALQVRTAQMIDLILPKFIADRERSAVGGDMMKLAFNALNPFRRKSEAPVVYWSGILDSDSQPRNIHYQIPDYFNGSLRIMAVAVENNAVGSQTIKTQVKSDIVLQPSLPLFAAPGDEYKAQLIVTNTTSHPNDITIHINNSEGIYLPEKNIFNLHFDGKTQAQTITVPLKILDTLGNANITFTAQSQQGEHIATRSATLSIRPALPFHIKARIGVANVNKTFDIDQDFYAENHTIEAGLSSNPLLLIPSLQSYLKEYPYDCTEQLVSKNFVWLALAKKDLSDTEASKNKIEKLIATLRARQLNNGSFSYWPNMSTDNRPNFITLYAMHFLTEAHEQGYINIDDSYQQGLDFLETIAQHPAIDLNNAREKAYAIYLLTRHDHITTHYLADLLNELQKPALKEAQTDIVNSYIAATYRMLKDDKAAQLYIQNYSIVKDNSQNTIWFNQATQNAMHFYLIAKHFPEKLDERGDFVLPLLNQLNENSLDTLNAAFITLALQNYPQFSNTDAALSLIEVHNNKTQDNLPLKQMQNIHIGSTQLLANTNNQQNYFYQIIEKGYPKSLPQNAVSSDIEINREYRNLDGTVHDGAVHLGEELIVHIALRMKNNHSLEHGVMVDLIPGGFEIIADSIQNFYGYHHQQEDRMLFFIDYLNNSSIAFDYRIRATTVGKMLVPPIAANDMYAPQRQSVTAVSKIAIEP